MLLRISAVSKAYRVGTQSVAALVDVDFDAGAGTLTAIMGPSGSGKSTLLSVAGGLLRPDAGVVEVAGLDITQADEKELYAHRRQFIGFVFQNYNLIQMLSVQENVALPLELDGMGRRRAAAQAADALDRVGLPDLGRRLPSTLSGGQQQRAAVARAIVGGKKLILADEPTGALDSTSSAQVLDLLEELVKDGACCLLVTHEQYVAERAGRVMHMVDGRLQHDVAAAVRTR